MTLAEYNKARISEALPRWRKVAEMRAKGRTFADIATKLGIDVSMAHRLETKFQSWKLKQPANP